MPNIDLLKQLLELGWPALVTVFFGYLSITYIRDQREQIAYLRKALDDCEAKDHTVEVQHE